MSLNYLWLLLALIFPMALSAQTTQICNETPANSPTHVHPDCYEGVRIEAAGDPNCFDGKATIKSGDNIDFFATESVTLNAGFSTEVGAQFHAEVVNSLEEGCATLNHGICGVYRKPVQPPVEEIVAYDRFGNGYTEEELIVSSSTNLVEHSSKSTINTGYFNLEFIGNYDQAMIDIVSQVFADITALIPRRSNSFSCGGNFPNDQLINIKIEHYTGDNTSVLAAATPLHLQTILSFNEGTENCRTVEPDRVWQKINGGNFYEPIYLLNDLQDALLFIDVTKSFHTDLGTNISGDEYDLYSVILHEVLHILGFYSLIDVNIGFNFSLWDRNLHLANNYTSTGQTSDPSPELFITGGCLDNCWNLNPTIISNNTPVPTSCQGDQAIIFGDNAIAPVGTIYNNPDNSSGVLRNYLSHLNEDCNGSNRSFVMHPSFSIGEIKRAISPEELEILCKLGYQVNTPSYNCDGCYALAYTDDYPFSARVFDESCCTIPLVTKVQEPLTFTVENLLCNDFTNITNVEITDIKITPDGAAGANFNLTENATSYEFLTDTPGIYLVRYTIGSCDCFLNTQSSRIIVSDVQPMCVPNECENLACPNDFEGITSVFDDYYLSNCAERYFQYENSLGVERNINSVSLRNQNNNQYVSLSTFNGASAGLSIQLSTPILPGCTATIEFESAKNNIPNVLELLVFASELAPCPPNASYIPLDCNDGLNGFSVNCENYDYIPYCVASPEITNIGSTNAPNLQAQIIEWENNTGAPIHFITFSNPPLGDRSVTNIYLDNIKVSNTCPSNITLIPINAPTAVCKGTSIDLNFELCVNNLIPSQENIAVELTLPQGLSFASGNGQFSFTLSEGQCVPLTFSINISEQSNFNEITLTPLVKICEEVVNTATVTIDIISLPSASFSTQQLNCSSTYQFTAMDNDPNTNHSWDFNQDGFPDAFTNSVSYDFGGEGTFTVEHSVSNSCGNSATTRQVSVNFANCCTCINGITAGTDENSTTTFSSLSVNDLQKNACIEVNGKLIIDENLTIQSSEMIMNQGAKIEVQANQTLTITGSNIHGCDQMWRSITIGENAILVFKENLIQDAEHALQLSHNVSVTIQDNTFNRNHIGITTLDNSGVMQNIGTPIPIKGNYFTCTSDLLPTYSGQAPLDNNNKTRAGIYLRDASMAIGSSGDATAQNFFTELNNGILSERSGMGIYQVQINDLQNINDNYGIQAVGGFVTIHHSTFDNSGDYAIHATGTYLSAENNGITNVEYGILHQGGILSSLIRENTISSENTAIDVLALGLADMEIFDNTIVSGGANIRLRDINGNGDFVVTENDLTVEGGRGILLNNTEHIRVGENNPIFIKNQGVGILVLDSENNTLHDNLISSTNTGTDLTLTPLAVEDSPNTLFCCNTIDQARSYLLAFYGMCADNQLKHTTFLDSEEGAIFCDINTIIGQQTHHGNLWEGTYGGSIVAEHGGTQPDKLNSQFFIQDADMSDADIDQFPPYWPSTTPDPEWFQGRAGQAPVCVTDDVCNDLKNAKSFETLNFTDIFTAETGFGTTNDRLRLDWEAKRYLYQKLRQSPILLNQNNSVDNFYDQQQGTPLAQLQAIEEGINNLYTPNLAVLRSDWTDIRVIDTQIKNIDEAYYLATTAEQNTLAQERIDLIQEQTLLFNSLSKKIHTIQVQQLEKVAMLLLDNQNFAPNSLFEKNEQIVTQVYLETLAKGIFTLNSTQFNLIHPIAHQCAKEGGRAVHLARLLYSLYEDKVFEEDELCIELRTLPKEKIARKIIDSNDKVTIIPNPSKDVFAIQLMDETLLDTEINIALFDITGQLFNTKTLFYQGQSIEVIVNDLPEGLYYCSITNRSGTIAMKKVIVLK